MTRRSVLSIACGLLLASASVVHAQQTVVNFDELVGQGYLSGEYGGLWWAEGWGVYDWEQPLFPASSPFERAYFWNEEPASFDLITPGRFGGAMFAGQFTVFFSLFLNGDLVHTTDAIVLSDVPRFLDAGYAGDVDRVVVNGVNPWFVMDDVRYGPGDNPTITPEPVSLTLIATGLSGLAMARRRRRNQRASEGA